MMPTHLAAAVRRVLDQLRHPPARARILARLDRVSSRLEEDGPGPALPVRVRILLQVEGGRGEEVAAAQVTRPGKSGRVQLSGALCTLAAALTPAPESAQDRDEAEEDSRL